MDSKLIFLSNNKMGLNHQEKELRCLNTLWKKSLMAELCF